MGYMPNFGDLKYPELSAILAHVFPVAGKEVGTNLLPGQEVGGSTSKMQLKREICFSCFTSDE